MPLHPERYGFLPWGEAPDGRVFAWRVVFVDPNQWATVAIDAQLGYVEFPGMSFSQFLLEYSGADGNAGPRWQGKAVEKRPRLALITVQRTDGERWAYVSGHLEGDEIEVGDEVILAVDGVDVTATTVRSVEKYSPPPIRTIAVDAAVAELL